MRGSRVFSNPVTYDGFSIKCCDNNLCSNGLIVEIISNFSPPIASVISTIGLKTSRNISMVEILVSLGIGSISAVQSMQHKVIIEVE